jgi:hypothetical protein
MNRPRFRLKTLMIVVAVTGLVLGLSVLWLRSMDLHIHDFYFVVGARR